MKLDYRHIVLLMAVVVGLLTSGGVRAEELAIKQPITIGLDANYAPLQSVGRDGIPRGYDVDFTRALMSRLGIQFYYSPNLWAKVATDVLNGTTDLAMMVYSPYRKDTIFYSRPIFRLYYQVVYRKAEYSSFDFRDIKGKTIAFLTSRHIGDQIKKDGGIGVHVYDLTEAFNDLAAGKYDAVVCYRYQAKYYIEHYHLSQLQAEEISIQPREYCYVSHNKALIDTISSEIEKMEAEGLIDQIYGEDVKQPVETKVPEWVWYMFVGLGVLFITLYIFILNKSRRKLELANAMLETNYNILEMSHMELEETNRQLIAATAKAEESSKMKTNFIQQISHEIRTPLNILSGFTQIITTPGMELKAEEKANITQGIVENTERITSLVNKMLELSEAGSRNVIERNDTTTAAHIVNDTVRTCCLEEVKDINLELDIEPAAETISIKTDINSAVRALSLLIDNAQKFTANTADRHIKISAKVNTDNVEIAVADNGIGIPKEEAEHIFEEFVQLDEFYEGTGIGLTIARSLAQRLGGDITLDTSYSPGARFVLTLPM